MTTGASLACPTNCTMGLGFRKGIGAIPFHPFWLTAFSWVSFGLESQRECLELTADCWRGVWLHSLASPLPCLTVLPELHTPWPCGPTLTPEALQGVEASSTLCTTLYTALCMLISLTWGFDTCPIGKWRAVSRSGLTQASLTIVGVWAGRSGSVYLSSPTTSVPWATGGTSRATTLLCPSQSSHQPSYLVP